MLTIGLVLLLAAAVVVVDVLLENSWHVHVTIVGQDVHLAFCELTVAGVVIGLVFALGLWIAMIGVRQQAALRGERRRLRRELRRRPAPLPAPPAIVMAAPAATPEEDPERARVPAPTRHRRGAARAGSGDAGPAGDAALAD